ncbi:DinB family protein [Aureibaculum conchae]|uniref:DinB family protein n=1 Tax=Aureibaculum sp. 2308TA14-22 TaxID=3108392 RepID=UPI003396A7A8
MDKQFDILRANRLLILKIIDNYSLEQLNKIPEGFKNNIAWNIAHLVVTQQLLCYKFSGLPLYVSDKMVEKYKKGTAPKIDITQQELNDTKKFLLNLVDQFEDDYGKNIFKSYQSYTTSANVTLNSISDAIEFNNFHEGIHLGYILALKKMV